METGETVITNHHAHFAKAMMPLALGLAVGVPCFVGYNHLVAVVGSIVIDMEKAGLRALRMVSELERPTRRSRRKTSWPRKDEEETSGPELFEEA